MIILKDNKGKLDVMLINTEMRELGLASTATEMKARRTKKWQRAHPRSFIIEIKAGDRN